MNEKAGSNPDNELEEVMAAPPITLEAAPEYLLGLPMIVAVTVTNTTPNRTFYNLPECSLWTVTGPVEFVFAAGGEVVRLGATSQRRREGPPEGFTLRPGAARRMLFDMAGLEPKLKPGTWRLEARYHTRSGASMSAPVTVRIIQPDEAEAQAAAALQRDNDLKTASWLDFLQANWRTVKADQLSARARAALRFHLFLHRAIYGPQAVGELRLEDLQFTGPVASEAALYRWEILRARQDAQAAAAETSLLQQWPGLRERVEESKHGEGLLTRLRQRWGAQRDDRPPGPLPYTNR